MKKITIPVCVLSIVAAMFITSCGEVEGGYDGDDGRLMGDLKVKVNDPVLATKAETADLTAVDGDLSVTSLQVLAYNYSDGKLARDLGRKTSSITYEFSTPDGGGLPAANGDGKRYVVAAVANYADQSALMNLSGASSLLGGANNLNLDLKDIFPSATRGNGILRIGTKDDVMIKKGSNSATVVAKIPAFRAVLRSLNIDLYDKSATLEVKGIMLINAMSKWNLGMTGNPTTFVNLAGRKSGAQSSSTAASDFIKGESDIPADYRATTWKAISGIKYTGTAINQSALVYAVYGLPNATQTDSFAGPVASGGAAFSRAVLVAVYKTADREEYCYYPVSIPQPGDGKTYDINMTIKNEGSLDPNDEPKYGALTVTVTVNGWANGAVLPGSF